MRARPPASVSGWMLSVAEVLPLPHRTKVPYTLGSAIAELSDYAQAVGVGNWNTRAAENNRSSLRREIDFQAGGPGPRLARLIGPQLEAVRIELDARAVVDLATRFADVWRSPEAIQAGFRDLCDAAQAPEATSRKLRRLSGIIASQMGPAAESPFSPLNDAAIWLSDADDDLFRGARTPHPSSMSEQDRVLKAEASLSFVSAGQITVWLAYFRAIVDSMRTVAGPITFLRADWALPNAFNAGPNDFPERAELIRMRSDVHWLADLHDESLKVENRLALVRVDLGDRPLAGAVEEAQRRVEAILSVAVEAGGVSWQSAGAHAVLVNGEVRSSSLGLVLGDRPIHGDDYGMGATAELLTDVAEQLGNALDRGPMPEAMVEALSALREARLTEHRDVLFFGVRPVSPRVATALEDDASELIASLLGVHAKELAEALQVRAALDAVNRHVAGQLMAPFDGGWLNTNATERRELERTLVTYVHGRREVAIASVIARAEEIRSLSMSDLQRADFESAFAICTNPPRERELLDQEWKESDLLRARLRRVRNAVNHGLPLSVSALDSVRGFGEETSASALYLGLTWFKNGGNGELLIQRSTKEWSERTSRVARGVSWLEQDRLRSEIP